VTVNAGQQSFTISYVGGDGNDVVLTKVAAPAPTVATVTINNGAAQRSRVADVEVTFNSQVTIAAGAFTITGTDVNGNPLTNVTVSFTTQVVNGKTVATLSFTGTDTQFGSLSDGTWTLKVDHTKVTTDGTAMAADYTQSGIKRLFGDVNGDATVNGLDYANFRAAFGTTLGDANYRDYLDFNADGAINGFDFAQFRARFGTTLP
jgi:hypothetical protein